MARDAIDSLYEDDYSEEEWPARAIETFPFWGQVLAWLSWKMPLKVYVIGFFVGLGTCFWFLALGVTSALLMAVLTFWGFYCRTNYPSPWGFVVIQTQEPVPGALREAAREGRPVPPEHPDAQGETRT